ncbi:hypothetical protein ABBQ32_008998 [Trebouxia sp. C0010 RCD-2024]
MAAVQESTADSALDTYAEGILAKYSAEYVDGNPDAHSRELGEALQRVREQLHSTRSSAAVCLICLENMHNDAAVWHCYRGCCCVLHLVCIQAWSRQQVAAATYNATPASSRVKANEGDKASWGCPKCRTGYMPAEVPSDYRCFCGKQRDPPADPWLAPHTCGDICGKELASGCEHTCVLLCHPGPCPPCPRQIVAACHCGKLSKPVRCSQSQFSCGKLCGKHLPCGHSRSDFQCERVCGRALPCARHRCEKVCHEGACGGCPMEGPRLCPCGKVEYAGLACDEEAAPCGATCDKLLVCGRHRCAERCHPGPCTPLCRAMLNKGCACGKTHKLLPCHETFRCEKKCSNWKVCGRHQCRRRCCDGDCPPCDLPCGRRLRCGNHKCPAPCHSGPCLPCPLTATVACACGQTKYSLPCGSEAKAVPPQCRHMCPVPPTCRHADARPPHRCHWGPCPPCVHFCGTPHPCGHACSSPGCHDAQPPPIPAFTPPPPPVSASFIATKPVQGDGAGDDMPSAAVQIAEKVTTQMRQEGLLTDCPPCQAPVPTACLGRHTRRPLPCCEAAPFCCGNACGQVLTCGNHSCSKPCHALGPLPTSEAGGSSSGGAAAEACEECSRPCERQQSCGHACPLPCHPNPCPPCLLELEQACHCGRSLVSVVCHQLQQAAKAERAKLLCCHKPCHKMLPKCPHVCQATCHPGACPAASGGACLEEVTVRCHCRSRRAKMPCQELQQMLKADEDVESYTDATPLRLLPCDGTCQKAKSKQEAEHTTRSTVSKTPSGQSGKVSSAQPCSPKSSLTESSKGPRRRNRVERAALQQQQELLEQQKAKRSFRYPSSMILILDSTRLSS